MIWGVRWLALAVLWIFSAPSVATAQTAAEFFKGREMHLLVGAAAGGGYDLYARFFARHLPNFLPGVSRVIVENLPTAGGLAMENTLFIQSPKDGSVIAHADGSLVTADLFQVQGARFKAQDFTWIGSMNNEVGMSVSWHTSPVKTAAEIFTHELIVGGTAPLSANVIFPNAMNRILGTKFKIVTGYTTTATIAAAMERGEVEGTGSWHYSSIVTGRPDWLRDGKINLLIQLSLKRHPSVPDVPTVIELAHTDADRAVLELIFAQQQVGRPIFGPPGVPDGRARALRAAFKAMMSDQTVLREADRQHLEINQPMQGEEIATLVARLHAMPEAIITRAIAATQRAD
jgi:tripartite-type tricarboxylate transporter receptor subunit TctC